MLSKKNWILILFLFIFTSLMVSVFLKGIDKEIEFIVPQSISLDVFEKTIPTFKSQKIHEVSYNLELDRLFFNESGHFKLAERECFSVYGEKEYEECLNDLGVTEKELFQIKELFIAYPEISQIQTILHLYKGKYENLIFFSKKEGNIAHSVGFLYSGNSNILLSSGYSLNSDNKIVEFESIGKNLFYILIEH